VGSIEPVRPRPELVVFALCQRELMRFFRQRNRVVGALGQPLLFWIFFGAGLGPSFRLPVDASAGTAAGQAPGFQEYFFPGVLVMIVLFTAIFSTISVIEDRKEGILQAVLVAPVPTWALVLGKLLGGSLLALLQAVVFLTIGCFTLGFWPGLGPLAGSLALLFVTALALCGLGFLLAWKTDSTQGYHAIMSLLLMPMWLLSGAFFPASEGWLGWIIRLNPLTYAVAALRRVLYFGHPEMPLPLGLPSLAISLSLTLLFALCMFVAACLVARRRVAGETA